MSSGSSHMKNPPDILCLYGARALRGFGDGFGVIILPVYLQAIGFSPQQIGIVASASLLGSAALTLMTGFIAPRFERRNLFLAGAGLMIFTGLVFPQAEAVAAAVEGPLSASCPASVLQLHPHASVLLDEAASAGLSRLDHDRQVYAAKPPWQHL